MVWGTLQLLLAQYQGTVITLTGIGLGFGLAAGIAVAASNLLLVESMTRLEASLGSTVYRLNTVGVVLLAVIFLNEQLTPIKLLAIGFGVAAVLILYGGTGSRSTSQTIHIYFWVAALASLFRACFGVISKAALNEGVPMLLLLLPGAACWIVGGIVYAVFRERGTRFTIKHLHHSVLAGVFVFLVVNTLLWGLERGDASTIIPIANLSFVAVLTASVIWRLEKISWRKSIAVVLAALCIWLMAKSDRGESQIGQRPLAVDSLRSTVTTSQIES